MADGLITGDLIDRDLISRKGDRAERLALHRQTAALKADAIRRRQALGRAFTERWPAPPAVVSPDTAFGVADFTQSELALAAREEALLLARARGGELRFSKGSLDYPLMGQDFAEDSAAVRFFTSPQVLGPVIAYFGMLPILFHVFMTRATASEMLAGTSHLFHLDPEDVVSLKVFLHLTPVEDGGGPFTALPADLSDRVVDQLGYRIGRVADSEVERIVGPGRTLTSIGPAGVAAFCDTTRCLHYGGRPRGEGEPIRELLVGHYVLPTCFLLPRFQGDGERPRMLPHLRPRAGEEEWNALIGAELA
jgi:hypothetical protein